LAIQFGAVGWLRTSICSQPDKPRWCWLRRRTREQLHDYYSDIRVFRFHELINKQKGRK
jgi:hypothetical protein